MIGAMQASFTVLPRAERGMTAAQIINFI